MAIRRLANPPIQGAITPLSSSAFSLVPPLCTLTLSAPTPLSPLATSLNPLALYPLAPLKFARMSL